MSRPGWCGAGLWPRLVLLAGTVLVLGSAEAMSLRELRGLELSDKKLGPTYVSYYLVGVLEGTLEAHAQAVRTGAKPQICINGRRLEPHMAKPLFDAELRRNKDVYEADMPVQLVLFNALSAAYAC